MADAPNRTPRLAPTTAWTVVTDAPLIGLALAREAGLVLAWDEANHLVVLDTQGRRRTDTRASGRILTATMSDDGSLIAVLLEGTRLLLLDPELDAIADRSAPIDSTALAMDPHGRYLAIASRSKITQFYSRHGRPAGSFETLDPLLHLKFVPDRPRLIGASAYGALYSFDLEPEGSNGDLGASERWLTKVMSNVGRLSITGDGGVILTSCYTHGVQRYDSRGRNEGSYHLGGTAAFAVPDFAGRTIAVATTEGELALLNAAGGVRWKTTLPRGPVALECDALGRFVIYGLSTGEITLLDLEGNRRAQSEADPNTRAAPVVPRSATRHGGAIREPAWTVPIAQSEEQAETTVVAVLDEPPRIAAITNRNSLEILDIDGASLGEMPRIIGVGRIIRLAPGWITAATDRQVLVYDARQDVGQRLDLSLVELSHLVVRPESYGLAIVQERDRIGRASVAGRWIWKRELRDPIEELAIGPDAWTAVSTEDGQLLIFDASGERAATYRSPETEPLALTAAPTGAPPDVAWISLGRMAQRLRGHGPDGRVVWESAVPWETWQVHPLESTIVLEAADGRTIAFNGNGDVVTESRAESPPGLLLEDSDGIPLRLVKQPEHLICADLTGRVRWRSLVKEPLGPIAAGRVGVAVLVGRALAFYPADPIEPAAELPGD